MATGDAYNTALYFHGAAMILAFLIPGLTGFAANYLVPLMIGAPDVAWIEANLSFPGRVTRDDWVEQARLLASGGEIEFSRRVDKGEVPSSSDDG